MTFAWKTVIADQGFAETCQVFNEPPRGLLFVSQRVAAGQLPITNYQLPITNYQLPITNYQLPITNYSIIPPTYSHPPPAIPVRAPSARGA